MSKIKGEETTWETRGEERERCHWQGIGGKGGSDGKESACHAGEPGLIPRLGRSPGEENGYPLWYSCSENSPDRGAWQAPVHGVAKSQTLTSDLT